MANALFDPGREGFLAGEIDWDTAVIRASIVRGYTFSASHKFLSDAQGAGLTIVQSQDLSGKTVTSGVADANDPVFTSVSGAALAGIIFYQASAVGGGADVADSAKRLIAWIDTPAPPTPNGGNLTFQIDNGTNKLFKL